MHIGDGIKSAFTSIASHKMRSALTTTGITIGVIAVVTMFSSIYALKRLITDNMEGMGWNQSVIIVPGNQTNYMGMGNVRSVVKTQRRAAQNVKPLDFNDYLAIKDSLDYKSIYSMIERSSLLRVGNQDKYITVRATENGFFINKNYKISKGRYFSPLEIEEGLPVAVLGHQYANTYMKDQQVLGESLILGDHRYRIVGILGGDELNKESGMNFNAWERDRDLQAVYVPLKYGAYRFGTNKAVDQIFLQSEDAESYQRLRTEARQLLLSRHNMYPNFSFMDIGAMMLTISAEIDKNMKKWNITLFTIASIALIVGGIGLFSTLLISIQERMTEIGIRKSIGATDQDIFFYFIAEALALAILGALIGIGIAWILISLMGKAMNFPLYLPLPGVLLGLFFSVLIGFLSGLYPAIKAAKIDPIKAIYYHD
ncbi:MAG: ABC transporter permease [Candidatus Cloacimonetes bacterium]|nr:ABC transporter permease [Candidatus Cloacimonadota bacterium]